MALQILKLNILPCGIILTYLMSSSFLTMKTVTYVNTVL